MKRKYIILIILLVMGVIFLIGSNIAQNKEDITFEYDISLPDLLHTFDKYEHIQLDNYNEIPQRMLNIKKNAEKTDLDSLIKKATIKHDSDVLNTLKNLEIMQESCRTNDTEMCFMDIGYYYYYLADSIVIFETKGFNKSLGQIKQEYYSKYQKLVKEWEELVQKYLTAINQSTSLFLIYEKRIFMMNQKYQNGQIMYQKDEVKELVQLVHELELEIIELEVFLEQLNKKYSEKKVNFEKVYTELLNNVSKSVKKLEEQEKCFCALDEYGPYIIWEYYEAQKAWNNSFKQAAMLRLLTVKGLLESSKELGEIMWPMSYPRSEVPEHDINVEACLKKRSEFYLYYILLQHENKSPVGKTKQRIIGNYIKNNVINNGEVFLYELHKDPSFYRIGAPIMCTTFIAMRDFTKFIYEYEFPLEES